jgi:C-terminal processing protease CtpA/Prc
MRRLPWPIQRIADYGSFEASVLTKPGLRGAMSPYFFGTAFDPCLRWRVSGGPSSRRDACQIMPGGMMRAPVTLVLIGLAGSLMQAQTLSRLDRERGHVMLRFTKKDLIEHYYDRTFHGLNMDERFREADKRIDQAATLGQMFLAIAGSLSGLGDAHTMFVPPERTLVFRYGWEMSIVGEVCRVTSVQPGSDAEAKGLRPGDVVSSVDGMPASRSTIRLLKHTLSSLDPRTSLRLNILDADGCARELRVAASIVQRDRVVDLSGAPGESSFMNTDILEGPPTRARIPRLRMIGDSTIVWKLPRFDYTAGEIGGIMKSVMGSGSLILDLRGNPGGFLNSLSSLTGYFFERDVTLIRMEAKGKVDSVTAFRAATVYTGRVIVLVDSRSASSSEVFARTMQIYGRGIVLGDVSGGSVMAARYYPRSMGSQAVVSYGSTITEAAITMPDGHSLEGVGVIPDEVLLPSSRDLMLGLDPVMARATVLAGAPLDAERSGVLFSVRGGN